MTRFKGKYFEVINKILTTMTARQNMLQTLNEVAVMLFIICCRLNWIVEAHCVKEVPYAGPPNRGKHTIAAREIAFGVNAVFASLSVLA
jgi:hypothetical protein